MKFASDSTTDADMQHYNDDKANKCRLVSTLCSHLHDGKDWGKAPAMNTQWCQLHDYVGEELGALSGVPVYRFRDL